MRSSARNFCGIVAALSFALAGCGSGDEPGTAGLNGMPTEKATTPTTSGVTNAQPVFRFAKISNGAYFYTGSVAEKDLILRTYSDFRCEGVAFYRTSDDSGTPVYRFANLLNGGYFYTASTSERDVVQQTRPDLRYEGTTFSVSGPIARAQTVYRLANVQNGSYLYTANFQEQQYATGLGSWRYEGEAFYGTPPPTNLAVPSGGWCPPPVANPPPVVRPPTINSLSKYVGTYAFCEGHERDQLTIAQSASGELMIQQNSYYYQNANCSGPIVGTYTMPAVVSFTLLSSGLASVTGYPSKYSLATFMVDRVSISSPGFTRSFTGTNVVNIDERVCVLFSDGGRSCVSELTVPAEEYVGGLILTDAVLILVKANERGYERYYTYPR